MNVFSKLGKLSLKILLNYEFNILVKRVLITLINKTHTQKQ